MRTEFPESGLNPRLFLFFPRGMILRSSHIFRLYIWGLEHTRMR